jgi:hypothetical protein
VSADSVLLPRVGDADDLLADHADVVPVDEFEVAAALEASGINDRVARQRYGYADVFALARQRFAALTEKRAIALSPAEAPDPVDVWGTLLRGAVFVLPAVLTGAALGPTPSRPLVWAVLVSVGVGWAAGQGVAYVGYRVANAGSPAGARWQMRAFALLVLLVSATCGTAAGAFGVLAWPAVALAVGQIAFVLASAIALVLNRPAVIGLALVPGLVVSVPALIWSVPRWLVLAAVVTTLAVALTWVGFLIRDAEPPVSRLARAAARGALAYVAYGASLALLLSFALVDGMVAPARVTLTVTMLPLICGVLVSEFQLARFRWRAEIVLRTSVTRKTAAVWLRRAVIRCLTGYLVRLLALTFFVAVAVAPVVDEVAMLRFAGAAALGWSFLAALLLVAYQQLRPVLIAAGSALVLLAGRVLGPSADASALALEYLVVIAGLAVTLTVIALRRLVRPELHR